VSDRPTHEEYIALLTATLEAARDGILVIDLDGHILFYNRHYLDLFGFTAAELEQGGLDLVLDRLNRDIEDEHVAKLTARELSGEPAPARLDILRFKDGRVFERYVAPHRIGGRTVVRVASFRDIGSSVRTAEALEHHRTFLEQAQEVAHIGSWVAELDGSDRLGWSEETHRIFGVPLGTFDGTSEAFYKFVHPDDRVAVRTVSLEAVVHDLPYDIEHRVVRPDGSVRWVHEQANILRDEGGRPRRMIGTVQDVTARRQLEDQLRQAQKMEAIGRLAGGIAHDLNNALTAIAGYAELALGEVEATHPARPDVEEIRRAAERAGSVTRQLLAFSRKQLLEPRLFDLNNTITGIARLLSRLLGSDVHIETHLSDDSLTVLGDPGQVEQAVINLAVNARDAMPGGGQLVLTTGIKIVDEAFARAHVPMPPGSYVLLSVADSGHGMSRDTQARIFEPFFTTKDVGKGTGLGLSMVYGTLKQIGGFIFVDSEIDRGTTFSLYFRPAASVAPVVPISLDDRRGQERETVLIVDDETAVRNVVASALRHDGYRLLLASSAEEALTMADAHDGTIDLLLTDAIMPGRSGLELANLMVARRPGLTVVVMSGYTGEDLAIAGLTEPVTLIQKPFTPNDLRKRIRDVLNRRTLA
jgi:two-component system, cell cycle sensor histidine kinase and response regulator CckA